MAVIMMAGRDAANPALRLRDCIFLCPSSSFRVSRVVSSLRVRRVARSLARKLGFLSVVPASTFFWFNNFSYRLESLGYFEGRSSPYRDAVIPFQVGVTAASSQPAAAVPVVAAASIRHPTAAAAAVRICCGFCDDGRGLDARLLPPGPTWLSPGCLQARAQRGD